MTEVCFPDLSVHKQEDLGTTHNLHCPKGVSLNMVTLKRIVS
jgi:hypothetical protein